MPEIVCTCFILQYQWWPTTCTWIRNETIVNHSLRTHLFYCFIIPVMAEAYRSTSLIILLEFLTRKNSEMNKKYTRVLLPLFLFRNVWKKYMFLFCFQNGVDRHMLKQHMHVRPHAPRTNDGSCTSRAAARTREEQFSSFLFDKPNTKNNIRYLHGTYYDTYIRYLLVWCILEGESGSSPEIKFLEASICQSLQFSPHPLKKTFLISFNFLFPNMTK